jgi:hypothetical protein
VFCVTFFKMLNIVRLLIHSHLLKVSRLLADDFCLIDHYFAETFHKPTY